MEAVKVRKNKAEENQFVAQISNDARNYFYIIVGTIMKANLLRFDILRFDMKIVIQTDSK